MSLLPPVKRARPVSPFAEVGGFVVYNGDGMYFVCPRRDEQFEQYDRLEPRTALGAVVHQTLSVLGQVPDSVAAEIRNLDAVRETQES